MSSSFDPYYKWLGIPPDEQPPTHYRLLGIRQFEPDADVIESAADRHMGHLQNYESGDHGELSTQLMSQISRARLCLMDASKKAAYDDELKKAIVDEQPEPTAEPAVAATKPRVQPPERQMPSWILATAVGVGVVALLLVAVAVLIKRAASDNGVNKDEGVNDSDRVEAFDKNDESGSGKPVDANDSERSLAPATGRPVDLFEWVDPSRHVFSGGWTFDGETLMSAGGQSYDGISIPYEPPEEYDVTMICERRRGNAGMILKLVAEGHDCNAMIDGWPTMGSLTGIHGLDKRDLPKSEVVSPGMRLTTGQPAEIIYRVRKTRLVIQVDGKTVIDWDADYTRCAETPQGQRKLAIVGNQLSEFAITKLQLRPVAISSE